MGEICGHDVHEPRLRRIFCSKYAQKRPQDAGKREEAPREAKRAIGHRFFSEKSWDRDLSGGSIILAIAPSAYPEVYAIAPQMKCILLLAIAISSVAIADDDDYYGAEDDDDYAAQQPTPSLVAAGSNVRNQVPSAAESGCEAWCVNPCDQLNGDVKLECGKCDKTAACHPGAKGYDDHAGPHPAPSAMKVGGDGDAPVPQWRPVPGSPPAMGGQQAELLARLSGAGAAMRRNLGVAKDDDDDDVPRHRRAPAPSPAEQQQDTPAPNMRNLQHDGYPDTCAKHCVHACRELTGSYHKECSTCDATMKCNPASADWGGPSGGRGDSGNGDSAVDQLRAALARSSASRTSRDEL